jgi:hypothetical protein
MAGSFCRHSIEKMDSLLDGLEGVAGSLSAIAEVGVGEDTIERRALWAGVHGIGSTVAAFREARAQLDTNLSGLEARAGISAEKPERASA